ncbi:MAG: hypothetical protein ACLS3M_06715 [Collinsella sp.]
MAGRSWCSRWCSFSLRSTSAFVRPVGVRSASSKRDYWIANFAGAAAVVLLTWVFSLFPLVQFAPIGWLGGFIAGLKMSFGESVGPWRKHDEVFNVNKAHRAAADAGDAEERRRARRNGAADRQLISVTDDSKGAGKHAKK